MDVLFNVGGSTTRVAVSRDGKKIENAKSFPTPPSFQEGARLVAEYARGEAGGEVIGRVSGGVPGFIDSQKGILLKAPNLPGWEGWDPSEDLKKELGASVMLANDTELEALGEAHFGAGVGKRVVAFLGIGTGVGGSRVVNGEVRGAGFEPGHQIIHLEGRPCGCGGFGHLEAYVGGAAVEKYYGVSPREISDPGVWEELARFLAAGLNNLAVLWVPDIIVLGGSMILGSPAIPIDLVRAHLEEFLQIRSAPPVVKAGLGAEAGLRGALLMLMQ